MSEGAYLAYRAGVVKGRREARTSAPAFATSTAPALPVAPTVPVAAPSAEARPAAAPESTAVTPERAVPGQDGADAAALASRDAELVQLRAFAEDRRALLAAVADARADVARYRQIVVDIENNAPPPLLASPGAPDDLRLIVGIGPVLERMLQQLGVATYRQIARWTERLLSCCRSGGTFAMRPAISITRASSSAAGYARFASPMRAAAPPSNARRGSGLCHFSRRLLLPVRFLGSVL